MADVSGVSLRTRTDDDLDMLYRIASDLDTWEERDPASPAPLTRAAYEARLARASENPDQFVAFVIDLDGTPVGTA